MSSMLGNATVRTAGIVVLLVAAFLGALVVSAGGVDELRGVHGAGAEETLAAGEFEFTYPAGWNVMPRTELPEKALDSKVPGSVVAGLCTSAAAGGACKASVDVSYLLFQEGTSFPALAGLETSLDHQLPPKFKAFRKESAALRRTAGGMQYLSYEFSFRREGARRHQLVAAYKSEGKGLMVVATGPTSEFAEQRSRIKQMIGNATSAVHAE
jgi:hypothetical protein